MNQAKIEEFQQKMEVWHWENAVKMEEFKQALEKAFQKLKEKEGK